jgi:hypothetical protein
MGQELSKSIGRCMVQFRGKLLSALKLRRFISAGLLKKFQHLNPHLGEASVPTDLS